MCLCKGLMPLSEEELMRVCESVIASVHTDADSMRNAKRLHSGDERGMKYFLGRVARGSKGRASVARAEVILRQALLALKL
jgi:Asp-tRNA(Asn)/Glu-tRNA(Gln) amidotransferase B subunit